MSDTIIGGTKKERIARRRILSWLRGEGEVTGEYVRSNYVPPRAAELGQYFTPPDTANELLSYLPIPPSRTDGDGFSVLDPCAGIGNLLFPLADSPVEYRLVAVEIEQECHDIGSKLIPEIEWHCASFADMVEDFRGDFDLVIMNPPYGGGREYDFLEMGASATRPEGLIAVLAQPHYHAAMPDDLRQRLDGRIAICKAWGPLRGRFRRGLPRVHAFIYERYRDVNQSS